MRIIKSLFYFHASFFNSIVYVNELLIKATEKEDPHVEIFNQYQSLCEGLSEKKERIEIEVLLRSFELVLLQELDME